MRRVAVASAVVLACMGLLFGTQRRLSEEREALRRELVGARGRQLAEAVLAVESAIDAEAHDLRLASRLLASLPDDAAEHVLSAIVQEETYTVVRLYDHGRLVGEAEDAPVGEPAAGQLEALGAQPCLRELQAVSIHGQPSQLVLATPVRAGGGCRTLVVVMDPRPLLAPLEVLSSRETTVHVLGADGEVLLRLPDDAPALPGRRMLRRVRSAPSGSLVIEREEAEEHVVAWTPVRLPGDARWTVAASMSTAQLDEAEAKAARQVAAGAVLIGLTLIGLAVYFTASTRRDAVKRRAERIIDSVPVGVVTVDAGGNVTGVNRALSAMHPGAGPGPLDALLAEADATDRQRIRTLVDRALAGQGGVLEGPMQLLGRPGEYAVQAVPVKPPLADVAALLVIADESELRSLRSQLLRAEKLATVGELAAGIAHEIGTPLSVVRGRAEYAARKLPGEHTMQRDLGVIVQQIDTVVRIIRRLLDFSSRRDVARGPVDLGLLIRGVGELLGAEAHRRGVKLELEAPAHTCVLAGDRDQLQQLLVNLVVNALDACEQGAVVRIVVERCEGTARLRVSDTGRGIPREVLHRIFDPFFTTKRRGKGTGLGLSVVTQVVRDHGGTVHVDSTEGAGTTFVVELPLEVDGA